MTQTGTGSPTHLDDVDSSRYAAFLRDAPRTGRCPVWIHGDALDPVVPARPPDLLDAVADTDVEATLAGWWPGPWCLPGCGCGETLPDEIPPDPLGGSYPDLSRSPETLAAAVEHVGPYPLSTLTLVDACRPADVPAAVRWFGIVNYEPYQDLVRLGAVLRRWEARYGALLVAMSRSRLYLSVGHPPTTELECRRAAAEHFSFCPDQQDPQNGDWYTLDRYAGMIRGARSWTFWWD